MASLLGLDPELGEGLAPRELAEARARALVGLLDLPAGSLASASLERPSPGAIGILVVDGLLLREMLLAGCLCSELLRPGDVVDHRTQVDALVPLQTHWTVPDGAQVAVLDDRLLGIVRAWPSVAARLLERITRQSGRMATHRAIAQLPRVEERILALFWHLAERSGRVGSAGIILPLRLTHETLGRLVGARRPTVSLALKELAHEGLIDRRPDGAWLMSYSGIDVLGGRSAEHRAELVRSGVREPGAGDLPKVAGDLPKVAAASHPQAQPQRTAPAEIAVLRERVAQLTEVHARQMDRSAAVIAHSRETRTRVHDRRRRGNGFLRPLD